MHAVGIRELKEHASDILRRVREDGDSFEVTYHGRVIARLVPVSASQASEGVSEFWAEWDRLANEISTHWPAGVSAVDAVREGRREL